VTNLAARNGAVQNRVDNVLKAQQDQRDALEALVSERTDADLAQALTDLELSQVAMQASAQVINQLRQVSLLNFLS
jgi:flagellar hook-associated protein 3 FlgL